jgi:hypothetical protein
MEVVQCSQGVTYRILKRSKDSNAVQCRLNTRVKAVTHHKLVPTRHVKVDLPAKGRLVNNRTVVRNKVARGRLLNNSSALLNNSSALLNNGSALLSSIHDRIPGTILG